MTLIPLCAATQAAAFLREQVTGTLHTDSRQVRPGDGFIAWPGAATDGRAHVADALARGASACLVERDGVEGFDLTALGAQVPIATLPGLKAATGLIAAHWWGQPSQRVQVLAVTGTNGKTSTAWWLAQALNTLSKSELQALSGCALVGTLGVGVPPQLEGTGLTTPDPVRLQRALAQWADVGLGFCAMEASSIGLAEHRMAGLNIRVAVLTNFTQDHLDYHGSMQAYWQAKRTLFQWPGLQAAVVHIDDPRGAALHQELADRPGLELWSTALERPARLSAQDIAAHAQGQSFTVVEGGQSVAVSTQLVGRYNVANLLGVVAVLRCLGVPLMQAVQVCAQLGPVPGRLQTLGQPGQPLAVVDYAHTPDALQQVLAALRPLAQQRGGRLWCVFGCGGNRDASKRPLMGAVALQGADQLIVTSDNPRHEDPRAILDDIVRGLPATARWQCEPARERAIAQALSQADDQDVVLIAGKGHECEQEIAGQRVPFSDAEHASLALAARADTPMMGEGRPAWPHNQ